MRGVKAKKIRRLVYGDNSRRQRRVMCNTNTNQGTIFNCHWTLRYQYQLAKKEG